MAETPKERLKENPKPRTAEEYLSNFPEVLRDAEKIQKFPVKDAKFCLVHIRQLHPVGELKTAKEMELDESDMYRKVRSIQTSIHGILGSIEQHFSNYPLYVEGIPRGQEEYWIDAVKNRKTNQKKYRTSQSRTGELVEKISDTIALLRRQGETTRENKAFLDDLQHQIGALRTELEKQKQIVQEMWEKETTADVNLLSSRIHVEYGKAELRGAEDLDAFLAAGENYDSGERNPELIYEMREQKLLEIIQNDNAPFAVTMYGAGHDWRDTIRKWNSNNPDKKFSLIVVTPEGYKKTQE